MDAYTEPYGLLSKKARDAAQALKSLQEEIEAINFYNQRAETCSNEDLKRIMEHNRDEEKEHAAMLAGWLKVYMEGWDKELDEYVTNAKAGNMGVDHEEGAAGEENGPSLNIGKL